MKSERYVITKQAMVNGVLESFEEQKKFGTRDGLEDYIQFKSVLDFASKKLGKEVLPQVGNVSERFNRVVAAKAIQPSETLQVTGGGGLNLYRYVHKSAVDKLVNWLIKNPAGAIGIHGVSYIEPTVDDAVDMICEKPAEAQVTGQPVITPEPTVTERTAALERLKEHIDLSVNAAVERHLAAPVNLPKITDSVVKMAADYQSLLKVLDYHRSVGEELIDRNKVMNDLNSALLSENEQLRRELTAVSERLNTLSRATSTPSIFQRWFGAAA